ncbi:hypothetical protein L9F63_010289, partial [Diploptera punctata]
TKKTDEINQSADRQRIQKGSRKSEKMSAPTVELRISDQILKKKRTTLSRTKVQMSGWVHTNKLVIIVQALGKAFNARKTKYVLWTQIQDHVAFYKYNCKLHEYFL